MRNIDKIDLKIIKNLYLFKIKSYSITYDENLQTSH